MRRMLVVGTAASLIGLAAAALGGGGTNAHAQPSDAEAVRAAASAFYAALNARDIRAMEAVWSRDADPVLIAPASRSPVVGWEAVRRSFEEARPRFEAYLAANAGYQTNRFPTLTDAQRDTITRRWGAVIDRYGYPRRATP